MYVGSKFILMVVITIASVAIPILSFSFIGDRDLLDCCGQSPGSGSTGAAGESANVQHICKVNESR